MSRNQSYTATKSKETRNTKDSNIEITEKLNPYFGLLLQPTESVPKVGIQLFSNFNVKIFSVPCFLVRDKKKSHGTVLIGTTVS